ncbi:lysophospholipid acyltransferase family protein [Candidatus Pelagibacter sp.]|nr:lysophospholipid acyltransferase family protein [Candidatus Pelagibacter sp.]
MKNIKYLIQFILVMFFFGIFKIIGLKNSKYLSGNLMTLLGPMFRSKKIIFSNLSRAFPNLDDLEKEKILKNMWFNYGKIFAEYMFIKEFRNNPKESNNIIIENPKILEKIKTYSHPVIFVSGHFNNFELMAMEIEKSGIDLAAVYRPLNNKFINPIMENIRRKYICKKQIKKGLTGTKELLLNFKKGTSIALMIDQRVSQGIKCNLFGQKALTTTIPAQFVKKYNAKIVPVYIERKNNKNFKIIFQNPLEFTKDSSIEIITTKLNKLLESMIEKNPDQWIWSHNRWK